MACTFQQDPGSGQTLSRRIDDLPPAAMPKQSLTSAPGVKGRPVEHRRSLSSVIEVVVLRPQVEERLFLLSMRANSVHKDRKEAKGACSSLALFDLIPGFRVSFRGPDAFRLLASEGQVL